MTEIISDDENVETESAPRTTVLEFFDGLVSRAYVTRDHAPTEYIFGGTEFDDDGNSIVALYHSQYGTRLTLDATLCQRENDWETVISEDGEPKQCEPVLVNALYHAYDRQMQIEEQSDSLAKLRDQFASARRDFEQVNDFINQYATQQGMCGDYERRLDEWNDSLATFKLAGRPRDWSVEVRVTNDGDGPGITGYIEIEARSLDEAKSLARGHNSCEILRRMASFGDDYSVEILD